MDRILCAWLPTFAVESWRRRNPSASPAEGGEGFALVSQTRGVRRLSALDSSAAALGLFSGRRRRTPRPCPWAGSGRRRSRSRRPRPRPARRLGGALLAAVAGDAPDGLFLDITGVAHLWGGEAALVADLSDCLAALGFAARIAVAGTVGAAWALARFGETGTILDPGRKRPSLPLCRSRRCAWTRARRPRWPLGLVTIGRLAAQPRAALTRRFGRLKWDCASTRPSAARRSPHLSPSANALVRPAGLRRAHQRAGGHGAGDRRRRRHALRAAGAGGPGARRFEIAFHRVDGKAAAARRRPCPARPRRQGCHPPVRAPARAGGSRLRRGPRGPGRAPRGAARLRPAPAGIRRERLRSRKAWPLWSISWSTAWAKRRSGAPSRRPATCRSGP